MRAWTDGWTEGWMGGWVDGSMDLWIYGSTYLRIYVSMYGWMQVCIESIVKYSIVEQGIVELSRACIKYAVYGVKLHIEL